MAGRIDPQSGARPPVRTFDYLCWLLLLIQVWRIQDMYTFLAKIQLPILGSLLAAILWISEGHFEQTKDRFKHPVIKWAIFIIVWIALTIPGSVYTGMSFSFLLNDHSKTFLAMLLIASSIRSFAQLERLALVHVAGATLYCIKILTVFQVEANGRLGNLYYYDANDLAMLGVATLPMAIYFVGKKTSPAWLRLGSLVATGVLLLAIVKTGSRGGFIGMIAVGLFLLFGFRAIKSSIRFGTVAAGVIAIMSFAGANYWTMMSTLLDPKADYNWAGNNDEGRMAIWERGMGYMAHSPLFGVGAYAFPVAEGTISALADRQEMGIGLKWSAAHNSFVQIGAELGVPGLLAFLLMLWNIGRANRKVIRKAKETGVWGDEASIAQALQGALIAYVVCGFFLSQAYSTFLYSLCGMVVGLSYVAGRTPAALTPAATRFPWQRQTVGGLPIGGPGLVLGPARGPLPHSLGTGPYRPGPRRA